MDINVHAEDLNELYAPMRKLEDLFESASKDLIRKVVRRSGVYSVKKASGIRLYCVGDVLDELEEELGTTFFENDRDKG